MDHKFATSFGGDFELVKEYIQWKNVSKLEAQCVASEAM
jgi:hypothetical protein